MEGSAGAADHAAQGEGTLLTRTMSLVVTDAVRNRGSQECTATDQVLGLDITSDLPLPKHHTLQVPTVFGAAWILLWYMFMVGFGGK